jgi:hypothetical protein
MAELAAFLKGQQNTQKLGTASWMSSNRKNVGKRAYHWVKRGQFGTTFG